MLYYSFLYSIGLFVYNCDANTENGELPSPKSTCHFSRKGILLVRPHGWHSVRSVTLGRLRMQR
ncbi:hypothetical protein WG66_004904 [Moniliophthora roreri]|nr:hypothetical protein WG66_004904 [Moniliophthora roreri]